MQLRLGDASPTPLTELVDRIERPSRPVELTVHREGAPYLRALVGPEDDHVDLSVRSTAVGLVLDGLNQPSDDALLVGRAAAEREPAVHELATFLAGCLAVGARSIDDARRFPGFAHKRLHAVQSVQRAARAREQSRP